MLKRFVAGLIVAVVVASPAFAGPVEDAQAAASRSKYAEAQRQLAERGDANAQYTVGLMYAMGQGVAQDDAASVKWYRLAAEQGHADAASELAFMYRLGAGGVPRDYVEAAKWYRQTAVQGDKRGQRELGRMYLAGYGVPQDFVTAHMWFNLSAAQGDRSAVEGRDIVAKQMTPDQLAEAQRLAREWKPTTAR